MKRDTRYQRVTATTGVWLVALLTTAFGTPVNGQSDEAAMMLVAKAGDYVQEYERRLTSIVCEERQTQLVVKPDGKTGKRRDLVSDVLIVKVGGGTVSFRDVMAVDGKSVRDRQARLRKLFLESPRPPLEQARRITAEGARYNIGGRRLLDPLMLSLGVLRHGSTSQFRFTRTDDGVGFEEWPPTTRREARQRTEAGEMFLSGRFEIAQDGRVLSSSFSAIHPQGELKVDVRYGEEPSSRLLVPLEMHERYSIVPETKSDYTDVSSSYSACRQFHVTVDERFEVPR